MRYRSWCSNVLHTALKMDYRAWWLGWHTSVLLHGTKICGDMVAGYAVSMLLQDIKCYRQKNSCIFAISTETPTKQIWLVFVQLYLLLFTSFLCSALLCFFVVYSFHYRKVRQKQRKSIKTSPTEWRHPTPLSVHTVHIHWLSLVL